MTVQTFNPKNPNPNLSPSKVKVGYHHKANHNQNRTLEESASLMQIAELNGVLSSEIVKTPKVGFVSLGCPKALVDSERIITELTREGYQVAKDYDGADLVVVNTCGFIESAVQESLDALAKQSPKTARSS